MLSCIYLSQLEARGKQCATHGNAAKHSHLESEKNLCRAEVFFKLTQEMNGQIEFYAGMDAAL